MLGLSVYLFICEVTTTKVHFRFHKQCNVTLHHVVFASESILNKMLVSFFSSIFLYIETNTMKKLCNVLEMELKKYTPFDLKFVFEKM